MHYIPEMRTTLAIDDDVLEAARLVAKQRRRPLGEVISDLARQSISRAPGVQPKTRNGVVLLPLRPGAVVTTEQINALRDELP